MAFTVVLDANVLYPFSLRDTLLRLAERELYALAWSERILDEVSRNLIDDGRTDAATAARLRAAMRSAFPEALASSGSIPTSSSAPCSTSTDQQSPPSSPSRPRTSDGRRSLRHSCLTSSNSDVSAGSSGEYGSCWSCHSGRTPRSSKRVRQL